MSDGFVALEFPAWIRWGQRRGADVDMAAFVVAFPDARHYEPDGVEIQRYGTASYEFPKFKMVGVAHRCRWCGRECPGRRTSWCSDTCNEKFYRVHLWQNLTTYIFERDGGSCRRCGTMDPGEPKGACLTAWNVDHIKPVRNGGDDHPDNLRLLCHDCHVAVGYEQRREEKQQLDVLEPAEEALHGS